MLVFHDTRREVIIHVNRTPEYLITTLMMQSMCQFGGGDVLKSNVITQGAAVF